MNEMIELLRYFRGSIKGSRSSALAPLTLLVAAILAALGGSAYIGAAEWVTQGLVALAALAVLVEIGSYVYLLITDRDALRSERFNITKMQIEKGILGDSISGSSDREMLVRGPTKALEEANDGR